MIIYNISVAARARLEVETYSAMFLGYVPRYVGIIAFQWQLLTGSWSILEEGQERPNLPFRYQECLSP